MIFAFLLCAAAGSLAGFLNGLMSMGGAFILVPSLNYIFSSLGMGAQTAQLMAIGSAPAAMLLTIFASYRAHARLGNISYPIFFKLAIGGVFGCIAGSALATILSAGALKIIFGLLNLFVGSLILFAKPVSTNEKKLSFLPVGGFFFGVLAALTGIAGTLICLTWLNLKGVEWRRAVGASSGLGMVATLTVTISYIISGWNAQGLPQWSLGYIWVPGVIMIIIPGMVAATLGAKLVSWKNFPVNKMKKAAAPLFLAMGMWIIYNVLK